MILKKRYCNFAFMILIVASLYGCNQSKDTAYIEQTQKLSAPVNISHELGTTTLDYIPQRVAVLDMNEADFLDQLHVPIAGMTKDFIPHFLKKYQDDPSIRDLGAIVQPNMEFIYALKPDLILMTPIQANHYQELSKLAPTLHYDINFNNSQKNHVATIKAHLMNLGTIFQKQSIAKQKVDEIDKKITEIKAITDHRSETALVVLHNNGAFSNFGPQSRYGFVFNDFGVKPASTAKDTSLHGQPISSEFIKNADPDILYIVDRTAVMEHRPVIQAENMSNPLLRETKAWKKGRVVFVDADAWYTTGASPTALKIMINDVKKGYQP